MHQRGQTLPICGFARKRCPEGLWYEKRPNHRGHRGTQGRTRGTTNAAGWTRPSEFINASIRSLYAAPNLTDTSFDTPGSCMVTP